MSTDRNRIEAEVKAAARVVNAEYQRKYYAANKDAVAERKRKYYAANKDAVAERRRKRKKVTSCAS